MSYRTLLPCRGNLKRHSTTLHPAFSFERSWARSQKQPCISCSAGPYPGLQVLLARIEEPRGCQFLLAMQTSRKRFCRLLGPVGSVHKQHYQSRLPARPRLVPTDSPHRRRHIPAHAAARPQPLDAHRRGTGAARHPPGFSPAAAGGPLRPQRSAGAPRPPDPPRDAGRPRPVMAAEDGGAQLPSHPRRVGAPRLSPPRPTRSGLAARQRTATRAGALS